MAEFEEKAIPVTVREAFKQGEFLVSEPNESKSISACNRLQLEKKLSLTVLEQLCSENWNDDGNDHLSVYKLVAVNAYSMKTWFRGQIRNILYGSKTLWSVLLVDRGELIEVERKNILSLPDKFRHQPFYAQYAVLGDVVPLSKKLNLSTLKLAHTVVKDFEERALTLIRDLLSYCDVFKMTVFGQDSQQRLHIRLFFKSNTSGLKDPYTCLNTILCEEKFALLKQPSADLKPVNLQSATCFWETLSDSSVPLSRENEIQLHTLGIADYAQALEKETNRRQQELGNSSASSSPSKSSVSSTSPFNSPSNQMRCRGLAISSSYSKSRKNSPGHCALKTSSQSELLVQRGRTVPPPTISPGVPTNFISVGRASNRLLMSHHTQPSCIPGGMSLDDLAVSRVLNHRNKSRNLQPNTLETAKATPKRTSPALISPYSDEMNVSKEPEKSPMEDQIKKSPPSSEPHSEKMTDDKELLELLKLTLSVQPKLETEHTSELAKPQLKGLSKLKGQMELGRVLVRSPFQDYPQLNLNEIPFETVIQEALHSLHITKPKIIQSYVWHYILTGFSVAFIAGSRSGKTLGYLVPILNSLLLTDAYTGLPKGCSPKAVVICNTWESVETVRSYCFEIMKRVPEFHFASLTDSSTSTIKDSITRLVNGVTLLVATAPALANVMEEGGHHINFDRCCHLVYEDADALIQEHPTALKRINVMYNKSVQRTESGSNSEIFVPRQVIACGSHWTPGMHTMTTKAMNAPLIFIASCMEAAIYGKMKLNVQHGTPQEMNAYLVKTVREKQLGRTMIFCRSPAEVLKVKQMLGQMDVKMLTAHDQSITTNFDVIEQMWMEYPAVVLICTDDILIRLGIKNADTLIHYYIPHQSQYDFSYRLSFCLDKFKCYSEDNMSQPEKPESHLLITKEFNNSLLTVVRYMQRFGLEVSDELATEAILSYCGREIQKKDLPLCLTLKSFGFCRKPKLCGLRHIILDELDRPVVPSNGLVDLRISAVHSTTNYYARILRHRGEDGRVIDMTAQHCIVEEQIKNYFSAGAQKVARGSVQVGDLYATLVMGSIYDRVRVECILDVDDEAKPVEVSAISIDQGTLVTLNVNNIYILPDHLKQLPPLAVEIFLAGIKPPDNNTTWNRSSTHFIQTELKDKVISGHIVLALSSTLWIDRLIERTTLEGDKRVMVNLLDVGKKILEQKLGQVNKEHMEKLYHLCQTGSIELPDYTVGLAKTPLNKVTANYAFLPADSDTFTVSVQTVESPQRFYVIINKWQTILDDLEEDIKAGLGKLDLLKTNTAQVGKLCVAKSVEDVWCRACIKEIILMEGQTSYKIFFVDYGDYGTASLEDLRVLSQPYIDRLPFQAIACSLQGLEPADSSGWSQKEIDFFLSLTRDSDNLLNLMKVKSKTKEALEDEVTMGPRYCVELHCEELELANLNDIFVKWRLDDEPVVQLVNNQPLPGDPDANEFVKDSQSDVAESHLEDDFEVSRSWIDTFLENNNPATDNRLLPSTKVDSKEADHSESESSAPPLIIDGIYPTKSASSMFPTSKWCQNKESVKITFMVGELLSESSYEIQLTDNHLSFATTVEEKRYELSTNLYSDIIVQQSVSVIVRGGVRVVLKKKNGAEWIRLTNSPFKLPWLSRDFDNWEHEWEIDDHDTDTQPYNQITVDPEYAFGYRQPDTSCSSESECSEEWEYGDSD